MDFRLFWLALGAFAIGAEAFVISSLLPQVSADTGVTVVQGGYLVLVFALAYALGAPVLASLSGHHDRRRTLTASMLVFTAGNILAGLAHSYEQLLVARIVMALAAGLFTATAQATAVAISEPHHRARAISVIVGGTTIAVAFGAPLGALIADYAGWRGTFWTIAAVSATSAAAIWTMLPAGLIGPRLPLGERLAVIARPGVAPALLSMLLPMTGAFAVFTYIAPVTTEVFRLNDGLLPAVLLAFGIGGALGNIAGGQLADRIGGTRTVLGATLLMAIAIGAMGLVAAVPYAFLAAALLGYMLVWGVLGWSLPPAQASRLIKLVPDAAPLVLSLNASAIYLGVALGSVVGGEVLTYAAPVDLGWIAALFPAAAFVVVALTGWPAKQYQPRLG
jgi:predicted MFS family arabinose efflux permease